jgi:hypothetical protein
VGSLLLRYKTLALVLMLGFPHEKTRGAVPLKKKRPMEHVVQCPDHDVWLESLERPYVLDSPFQGDDFVVLLVVNDPGVTEDERASLSAQVVRQGCRYAVCAGHECSAWDDAIDWAFIGSDPNFDPPNGRFVMTTWHEHDPLSDVLEWFRWNTTFGDFTPKNFLVLLLGVNRAVESEIRQALVRLF